MTFRVDTAAGKPVLNRTPGHLGNANPVRPESMSVVRPALVLILSLMLTGLGALSGHAQIPSIKVAPNVQVSKDLPDTEHYEVLVAADPTNPKVLLGCSMFFSQADNYDRVVAYASSDAGKTWVPTLNLAEEKHLLSSKKFLNNVDPACALGPANAAYLSFFGVTIGGATERAFLRSSDAGRTWEVGVAPKFGDREYIGVDTTDGKYRGRVYINSDAVSTMRSLDQERNPSVARLDTSQDGGRTFMAPALMAVNEDHQLLPNSNPVVMSDGTVVFLVEELRDYHPETGVKPSLPGQPNAWLKLITSEDGGASFNRATVIGDYYRPFTYLSPSGLSLAVDRSQGPFRDRLYAVWPDERSGRVEILFSYSSNKGRAWSRPLIVNDERRPTHAADGPVNFKPVIAANLNGVVGVMWSQTNKQPNDLDHHVRFTASMDGGETFLPSVQISEASSRQENYVIRGGTTGGGRDPLRRGGVLHTEINFSRFSVTGGDTSGMAADASGAFHPVWIDTRTGTPQIWTTSVTVDGAAMLNGSSDLKDLTDVTDKVFLRYWNIRFDREKSRLTFDAVMTNSSGETIRSPLKLRIFALGSDIGSAQVNAGAQVQTGGGVILDLSDVITASGLGPNQTSSPKHLTFELTDPRPFAAPPPGPASNEAAGWDLLRFDTKVFAILQAQVKKD